MDSEETRAIMLALRHLVVREGGHGSGAVLATLDNALKWNIERAGGTDKLSQAEYEAYTKPHIGSRP